MDLIPDKQQLDLLVEKIVAEKRADAEKKAREAAELEAAMRKVLEDAERAAAEKKAREAEELRVAERKAREEEREAAAQKAREAEEREAAAQRAREEEERKDAEREAAQKRSREAAEQRAAERRARIAEEREAAAQREREAEERRAATRKARQAERKAAEERAREAAKRRAAARRVRLAEEREAAEQRAREAAERRAAMRTPLGAEEHEAAARKARRDAEREARQAEEGEASAQKARAAAELEAREAEAREAAARKARRVAAQKAFEAEEQEAAARKARAAAELEALEAEESKAAAQKASEAAARKAREAEEQKAAAQKIREAALQKAREAEEREAAARRARESEERAALKENVLPYKFQERNTTLLKKLKTFSPATLLGLGILPLSLLFMMMGEQIQYSPPSTGGKQIATAGKLRKPPVDPPDNSSPPPYYLLPKRVELSHVQGTHQGIGYGTDYSTAALLFAAQYRPGHIMPMVDARVHRFDNNTYAANLGIAGRYIPKPNTFCEILGFNLFYDFRQGQKTDHFYHQIGAGIEVLGHRWDFRANCYYPFGMTKHHSKCVFEYEGGFRMEHRKCEAVSYGYNAEVGYYLYGIKSSGEHPFLLYAAAGPYYLARKCHDETLGGKIRLRPQYKDYLALDLSYSYDPVFRSVFQAEVIVTIPLYQMFSKKKKLPCHFSDRQIYQPIQRFEVMPLGKSSCWRTNF